MKRKNFHSTNFYTKKVVELFDHPKKIKNLHTYLDKPGIHFCFGEHAFLSDESEDYEFYILTCSWCDNDTWIILDSEGNIRVWDSTSEELFFGRESECVYEKNNKGEYVRVVV